MLHLRPLWIRILPIMSWPLSKSWLEIRLAIAAVIHNLPFTRFFPLSFSHTSQLMSFVVSCHQARLTTASRVWPPTLGLVLPTVLSTTSPSPLLCMVRAICESAQRATHKLYYWKRPVRTLYDSLCNYLQSLYLTIF